MDPLAPEILEAKSVHALLQDRRDVIELIDEGGGRPLKIERTRGMRPG